MFLSWFKLLIGYHVPAQPAVSVLSGAIPHMQNLKSFLVWNAVSCSQFYFMAATFALTTICVCLGKSPKSDQPSARLSIVWDPCVNTKRELSSRLWELHLSRALVPAKTLLSVWVLQKTAMSTAHRGPREQAACCQDCSQSFPNDCYITGNACFDINYLGSSKNLSSLILGLLGGPSLGVFERY